MNGRIKRLFDGYGFIQNDEGDFFFHWSEMDSRTDFGRLRIGTLVTFDPKETERGNRAIDVKPLAKLKGLGDGKGNIHSRSIQWSEPEGERSEGEESS